MPDLTPSVLFNRILGRVRLKHLQLAIAIADLQSLHRAASSIGLSQPAATHALVELESSLGGPLFERHSKGMRLTRLGEAVLPLLRASLVPLQAAAGNAALMQQGAASALIRIGSIAAGINGLLTVAIPTYVAAHPDAAIDVHEVTIDNLLESIQEGTLDLAICREPTRAAAKVWVSCGAAGRVCGGVPPPAPSDPAVHRHGRRAAGAALAGPTPDRAGPPAGGEPLR